MLIDHQSFEFSKWSVGYAVLGRWQGALTDSWRRETLNIPLNSTQYTRAPEALTARLGSPGGPDLAWAAVEHTHTHTHTHGPTLSLKRQRVTPAVRFKLRSLS